MKINGDFKTLRLPDLLFIVLTSILFLGYWLSYLFADYSDLYGTNYYPGLLNYEFFAQLFTVLLSLLVLFRILLSKEPRQLPSGTKFFLLFLSLYIGWTLLSTVWSIKAGFGWKEIRVWLGYLPLAFALTICLGEFQQIKRAVITLIAAQVACISMVVIYAYYANGCYVPYITFYLNRSLLGEMIIVAIPLLAAYGLLQNNGYHVFLRVCAILGYISVLIMAQRAPLYALWITLIVSVILGYIKYPNYRKKLILFWGILCLATVFYLTPSKLTGGLENWDSSRRAYNIDQAKDTFHYRINGVLVSFFQWKDNWLFGTGQGTYPLVFPEYSKAIVDAGFQKYAKKTEDKQISRAHCEPAQVAGELGIIGLTLWAVFFVFFPLRLSYAGWKQNNIVLLVGSWGLLAITISGLASSFSPRLVTTGMWYVIAGVLISAEWKLPASLLKNSHLKFLSVLAVGVSCLVLFSTMKTQRLLNYFYLIQISKKLPQATYSKELNKYKQLVTADPYYHYFYFAIANAMAEHGNLKQPESSHFWREAQDLGLFSSNLLASEAFSLYLQGKRDDALSRIDEGLHIFPDSWFLFTIKAAIQENESLPANSQTWQQALNLHPEATRVTQKVFKEMFTGKKQGITYQELYEIPTGYYGPLSVYYFNTHPKNKKLPSLFNDGTSNPWESP